MIHSFSLKNVGCFRDRTTLRFEKEEEDWEGDKYKPVDCFDTNKEDWKVLPTLAFVGSSGAGKSLMGKILEEFSRNIMLGENPLNNHYSTLQAHHNSHKDDLSQFSILVFVDNAFFSYQVVCHETGIKSETLSKNRAIVFQRYGREELEIHTCKEIEKIKPFFDFICKIYNLDPKLTAEDCKFAHRIIRDLLHVSGEAIKDRSDYQIRTNFDFLPDRFEGLSERQYQIEMLAYRVVEVLRYGALLVIDKPFHDFDYYTLKYFLELFHDKNINVNKAQLILNTQCYWLMDTVLRSDQVIIFDKQPKDYPEIYKLSDMDLGFLQKHERLSTWFFRNKFGGCNYVSERCYDLSSFYTE